MVSKFIALIIALYVLDVGSANAAKRLALVIGNSAYIHVPQLNNPAHDADLIAKVLIEAEFDVTVLHDVDQRGMKRALLDFGRKLKQGAEASMFYYAGHGIEVDGINYLVPVDSEMENKEEAELNNISLNALLAQMQGSAVPLNIIVLDACRNNPFSSIRSIGKGGLAPVQAPSGTYVAYATAPGSIAADGDGKNSPFTKALAESIRQPNLTLERVFKRTREKVLASTAKKQLPFDSSAITGEFYFHGGSVAVQVESNVDEKNNINLDSKNSLEDFKSENVYQLNCHMDACSWMVVKLKNTTILNPSNRVVRIKYVFGSSVHNLASADGKELLAAYPEKYTPKINVSWEPDESEMLLLCSTSLPAVGYKQDNKFEVVVLDLSGGAIAGYQTWLASIYSSMCLETNYFKTSSEDYRKKFGLEPLWGLDETSNAKFVARAEKVLKNFQE